MAGSNSPFSSGSSISSILKSAQSTAERIQAYNDSVVAYNWQNSTKSYGDFVAYTKYLQSQASKTSDPVSQLAYQKQIDSARSGYISNEIQRQTQNVMEGRGTNLDKYNRIADLYYQAGDAGQYDLQQNLRSQLDSLSITIQNENKTAYASASSAAKKARVNAIQDGIDSYNSDIKALTDLYTSGNAKDFQDFVRANAQELGVSPNAGFFDVVTQYVDAAAQAYTDAMSTESDPSQLRKWQKAYNSFIDSNVVSLPTATGNTQLSYKDLITQDKLAQMGEQLYATGISAQFNPATGKVEEKQVFTQQQQTGYAYGRDAQGNAVLIPTYGPQADQFKPGQGQTGTNYEDLLKKAGYNVQNSNGTLLVSNTAGQDISKQLPGAQGGQTVQVYVDENGKLQFVGGDGQLYNFNFDDKTGQYLGTQKAQAAGIISTQDKHNIPYLSTIDQNTLPAGTIGLVAPEYKQPLQGVNLQPQNGVIPTAPNFYTPQAAAGGIQGSPTSRTKASGNALQKTISAKSLNALPSGAKITVKKLPTPKKISVAPVKKQPKLVKSSAKPSYSQASSGTGSLLQGGSSISLNF